MANLTASYLRDMLEGVPGETLIGVQTPNDPTKCFLLDVASLKEWGDVLVLEHTGQGKVIPHPFGDDDES